MDALAIMPMLVLMTLTFMLGHNGSAKPTNQCCMLSATKQAINIKLATIDHCLHDLDCTNIYLACPVWFFCSQHIILSVPDR